MRQPSDRELFLQNLLATSTTLLYRSANALQHGTPDQMDSLVVEIEQWFLDTQAQIRAAVHEDEISRPMNGHNVHITTQVVWVAKVIDDKLKYFLD